jgi:hypothetical protein
MPCQCDVTHRGRAGPPAASQARGTSLQLGFTPAQPAGPGPLRRPARGHSEVQPAAQCRAAPAGEHRAARPSH